MRLTNKKERFLLFANLSVPFNGIMAAGKLIVGIMTASFFLCVNAFYNVCMGVCKFLAVYTHNATALSGNCAASKHRQRECYCLIGVILFAAGVLYILYCTRMFIVGSDLRYPDVAGIAIAAFTFTEIFLSFAGVKSMRRANEPMLEAVKLTNFASALVSLVLTQTALLSFTAEQDMSFYNGISGIVFGGAAALIGVYMFVRMLLLAHGKLAALILRRAKKIIARYPAVRVEPLGFDDPTYLPLRLRLRPISHKDDAVLRGMQKKLKKLCETEWIPAPEAVPADRVECGPGTEPLPVRKP